MKPAQAKWKAIFVLPLIGFSAAVGAQTSTPPPQDMPAQTGTQMPMPGDPPAPQPAPMPRPDPQPDPMNPSSPPMNQPQPLPQPQPNETQQPMEPQQTPQQTMPQPAAPQAPMAQAEYPPCSATLRDQCTNPGEMAGRMAKKRTPRRKR